MAALRRVPWEIWAVLALIVLDGAAVIATYSRFPTTLLYNVTHSDTIRAGFGRELVALNFPFALVGIALVGLAWPRLRGWLRVAGVVAIALCASRLLRGRPERPRREAAERGARARARARRRPRARRGRLRCAADAVATACGSALAAVLVFFCAPLIAAELGFFLDGVPFLGWFYETGRLTTQPDVAGLHHAVHHGSTTAGRPRCCR